MSDNTNPNESPDKNKSADPQSENQKATKEFAGRQAYNVVTDTVTGVNIRFKDNIVQGLALVVCLLLGAGIGVLLVKDQLAGLLVGGFIGLLVGLFGSGIFLMLYRAIMHIIGRHD